jgi:hypothetical protein
LESIEGISRAVKKVRANQRPADWKAILLLSFDLNKGEAAKPVNPNFLAAR